MLFDLRGRGRRRTVQGVYLFLAVLIGGGLVLFGVGGSGSGGLLNGLSGNGSKQASPTDAVLARAQKGVHAHPRDPAAWGQLVKAQLAAAGAGTGFDARTQTYTAAGKADLRKAAKAWEHYLSLHPARPDVTVAGAILGAFGPQGLNRPAEGVRAAQIVARAQPRSPTAYFRLASFDYLACRTAAGDRAGRRAVKVTPKAGRRGVKAAVRRAKQSVPPGQCPAAGGTAGGGSKGTPGGHARGTSRGGSKGTSGGHAKSTPGG